MQRSMVGGWGRWLGLGVAVGGWGWCLVSIWELMLIFWETTSGFEAGCLFCLARMMLWRGILCCLPRWDVLGYPNDCACKFPPCWTFFQLNWKSVVQAKIAQFGLRNSLLVAPMPTASTAQILGTLGR